MLTFKHFLAGPGRHGSRKKLSCLRQKRKHLELVQKTLRRLHIHEHPDASRDFGVRVHAASQLHSILRADLVDQKLRAGMALSILEEKRGPSASTLVVAALGNPIRYFGDLKNLISLGLYALEFARAVERGDPLAKVVEGQKDSSLFDRRL